MNAAMTITKWRESSLLKNFVGLHFYTAMRGPEAEQKLRSGHKDQTDGNWSSFQLANSTPPQSVIDNAIAPPARIADFIR